MTSKQHVSNVNWRKVIENFRSGYQLSASWEILIVELLANSIDAKATEIWVDLEGEGQMILRVLDHGKGMSKKEFEDYHNLGSLAKHRGYGIGWAGIGAKLYIDRCGSIYTETRSATYAGASEWSFPKSERAPIYHYANPRGLLGGKKGTAVEIVITDPKDLRQLDDERVRESILANYNYAMLPIGPVVIKLNDERIVPFDPSDDSIQTKAVALRLKDGGAAHGVFSLLDKDASPGFSLVSIVVHGKTVGEQYDFRQFARIEEVEKISGYVQCDELIHATTTSKDNFNRKTSLWREFDKKVGKVFADWLGAVGHLKMEESDKALNDLAKIVQDALNEVLKLPEIRALNLDLFQNLAKRLAPIRDPTGNETATEVSGAQIVAGTYPGPGPGEGVPVVGDDPGKGLDIDLGGKTSVTQRTRQSRSGIQIAFLDRPGQHERAWPDSGLQAIVINKAYPAFKCAEGLDERAFYTIDACLHVVCDTIEEERAREETLEKLFEGYLKVAAGE